MQNRLTRHRPVNLLTMINIIGYSLLYLYQKPYETYTLFAGLSIIAVIYLSYFILIKGNLGDEYLFLIVAMLVSLGTMMLYRLDPSLGAKQITWFAGGILLFFLSYMIYRKVKIWDKWIYIYPLTALLFFIATLALGRNIKGATNWIVIGGYSFQPSELIKILFVFFLAVYFRNPDRLKIKPVKWQDREIEIPNKYVFMVFAYMFMGFLVLQRELGTTLLLFLIYIALTYVFEPDRKFLLFNGGLAVLGSFAAFLMLQHVKVRVEAWLNPWSDIAGKGYQITQSLFAVGSGGFFGTGIGLGRPDFIPEVHTDFIFSAICEEMGIFGGVAVVLLYFILAYRGFKIALAAEDRFQKAVALGLTVMFGFQTFIIIGGVIKLIPLTGITLPFVSYGGSSLTTSFISLGILQAISNGMNGVEEETVDAEQ